MFDPLQEPADEGNWQKKLTQPTPSSDGPRPAAERSLSTHSIETLTFESISDQFARSLVQGILPGISPHLVIQLCSALRSGADLREEKLMELHGRGLPYSIEQVRVFDVGCGCVANIAHLIDVKSSMLHDVRPSLRMALGRNGITLSFDFSLFIPSRGWDWADLVGALAGVGDISRAFLAAPAEPEPLSVEQSITSLPGSLSICTNPIQQHPHDIPDQPPVEEDAKRHQRSLWSPRRIQCGLPSLQNEIDILFLVDKQHAVELRDSGLIRVGDSFTTEEAPELKLQSLERIAQRLSEIVTLELSRTFFLGIKPSSEADSEDAATDAALQNDEGDEDEDISFKPPSEEWNPDFEVEPWQQGEDAQAEELDFSNAEDQSEEQDSSRQPTQSSFLIHGLTGPNGPYSIGFSSRLEVKHSLAFSVDDNRKHTFGEEEQVMQVLFLDEDGKSEATQDVNRWHLARRIAKAVEAPSLADKKRLSIILNAIRSQALLNDPVLPSDFSIPYVAGRLVIDLEVR